MKSIIRSLFGIISSLFLAVGFARAAEKLDPVSESLRTQTNVTKVAPDCVQFCNLVEDVAPDCVQFCNLVEDES